MTANNLRSAELEPSNPFHDVIDRLAARGNPVDWLPYIRPTDEVVPFLLDMSLVTERDAQLFRGRVAKDTSTTVGYAFRPRPGMEHLTTSNGSDGISDYAVKFVTTHADGDVTEVLFHIVRDREVWMREHLYEPPAEDWLAAPSNLPQQQADLVRNIDNKYRMSLSGGKLITDYNWDWDISTTYGTYGYTAPDHLEMVMRGLDAAAPII